MKKLLIFAILCTGLLSAQEANFGKNKVQYKPFNWSFIQTSHFDIYFYDGGSSIANFTAIAAESAYASISKTMRYQLNNRVAIMVYNSHNDFQQTNVVSEYLDEGIGGVTELFKNRVVLPFEGNYRQFRHVIHHELVHAVMNDMFYGGSIQSIISNNIRIQLPLWISEGFAEYEASKDRISERVFCLPRRPVGLFLYCQQIRRAKDRRDPSPYQESSQCGCRIQELHRTQRG
jgi:hypothetical protein